jgi:DNA invertase Pin-like site-specific DNA recombinase
VSIGAIDRIYVHSPDRLARNYAYQVLLIDEWHRRGIELVFLNRPLGQSPEDDLLLQVQGIIAEYERTKIMERSRRGKRHAAQKGSVNVMSGAPFGYRYVPVQEGDGQARFEPVDEQARARQTDLFLDRARPLQSLRSLRSASQGGRTQCYREANLVATGRVARSSESSLSGAGSIRENAHDITRQRGRTACSSWTSVATSVKQ